jgi:hypothetical protein
MVLQVVKPVFDQGLEKHAFTEHHWVQIMAAVPIGLVQPAHHFPIQLQARWGALAGALTAGGMSPEALGKLVNPILSHDEYLLLRPTPSPAWRAPGRAP